ncbi:DNA mismatch repair endonuclease MutL [Parapedobacter sp. ISTM3]|uniref:DNA mismatch repair endonuclease MutL n=1 Tax=Parapedobacter sp. ISTM3 TaxID=2800130 RepID=UPI00190904E9|nr:DNA mismatch repair endonuclease MutL [Parapedobacter sp. ISTM3]MBK1440638.1 DNA mismatch repair endonuclease MutL [Parapedobacter sp. ISTM3]
MSDIIQLLPDTVANQIAAGEVVQRPASAVKELIENAIDAGADKIRLIVKDAGKSLIQVIDNGCGMSVTDARLCFERHATSKIREAADLFAIRTMGFRGEALASIAAIAHVELKTRRVEDELGTLIEIEGSAVTRQEPAALPAGTSICVKNLFYNIPARRNFLKSNPVEMRHIVDEFQRVALAHPHIFFSLHSDDQELFHLPGESLKQRIVHVFGNTYNQRLVPVEEETTIINLKGFIGKPEFAKKTRGEQFFFVNNRFVKDPYLNHAVVKAYEGILPPDSFPLYVLFIEIDPAKIDINVHPTKTEIKYEDERAIYAILQSAVKRSLGRYNITPTLDFNQETGFSHMISPKPLEEITPPSITFNPDFNPFEHTKSGSRKQAPSPSIPQNWDTLYQITEKKGDTQLGLHGNDADVPGEHVQPAKKQPFQLHNRYIISQIHSGFILIDQQAAHERILFEQFCQQLENRQGASQQSLFPQTVTLSGPDFQLIMDLLPDIQALGFQIREFGKHTFVVEGIPADLTSGVSERQVLEQLLEDYKNNQAALKLPKREKLARSLAKHAAIKPGMALSADDMAELIDKLFACEMPNVSLNGKPIILTFTLQELSARFERD